MKRRLLGAETISIPSRSGERLAAWLVVTPRPRAAVVVLHGVRASRSDMVGRVEMLARHGFAVLAPDLQAHGESTGRRITYGLREADDAGSAIEYARHRFRGLKVGAIVSGTHDRHTTTAQTQALFAAAREPKEIWLIPGAAHVDLARFDGSGYEKRVVGFLERELAD